MEQTKNYGLNKQQLEDAPDIEQIFENWETIDGELDKNAEEHKTFTKAIAEAKAEAGKWGLGVGQNTAPEVSLLWSSNDANDIDKTGFYTVASTTNTPHDTSVLIHVERRFEAGNSALQITVGANGKLFTRTRRPEGWLSWQEQAHFTDKWRVDSNGTTHTTGQVIASGSNNPFVLKSPEIVKGTPPDTRKFLHIPFYDKNGTNNDTNRLGKVEYMCDPNGSAQMFLGVSNPTNLTEEELNGLVIRWDENGKPYVGVMHQPEKASNDASVATTRWVKSQISTTENYGLVRLAKEEELLTPANVEAVINPKMLYDLEDFRKPSTAYKVGDKVKVPFNFELFFECTTAGTTGADAFDPRNVMHGQTFTDGSVVWTVRTHVRSINGVVPDAAGDIQVPQYVHPNSGITAGTYNTVTVNAQGHVVAGSNSSMGLDEADVKRIVLDVFFPVGSTYISANVSFDPNTWGGTWHKIENKFLLGSGSRAVGTLGGEENVTLTENTIPSHKHGIGSVKSYGTFRGGYRGGGSSDALQQTSGTFTIIGTSGTQGGNGYPHISYDFEFFRNSSGAVADAGGGQAHNNMPPYEVVNVWKRVA